MARIISNYAFDQSNLDLNRLYSNSLDANLLDNSFLSYNGITYQDAYIVDWYLGGDYASVFGGYGINVDSFQNVTGGTVTGYLELFWNGFEYVASYAIEDISVQAVNLYSAAVSSSIFDDYTLIDNLLGGADNFFLSNQSDSAYGLGGNDVLVGYGGNDWLYGDSGNDSLTGGAGSDKIYGGDGIDTAFYSGSQSSYSLLLNSGGALVQDRRAGGEGSDELKAVEYLDFDTDLFGSPFNLTSFGGATGLSASDFESFIELYIAYFNRAPDAIGLNFWGTAYANGTSLQEMATLFADQEETIGTYPTGTTNLQFATIVYNNVLGRTPDQSGLDFWVGQLDSGSVTKDQFILEVLGGVQAGSTDRSYLDDKVDIGAYFAVHKGMSDTDNASAAMALFDGSEASINTAVAAIDDYYTDALDPNNGDFLMKVVGVLDDPFAGV